MRAIMYQHWDDVLFASWSISAESIRSLVPAQLSIDLYEERAWVSVVALRVTRLRLRGLPMVPLVPSFAELNLRTYVRHGSHRGVWFFRIEAASRLSSWVARHAFHAPYVHMPMHLTTASYSNLSVANRHHTDLTYGPPGEAITPEPNSIAQFLTNRTAMFTANSDTSRVYRNDIDHPPWALHQTSADIRIREFCAAGGIHTTAEDPLCYWAQGTDVAVAMPRRIA